MQHGPTGGAHAAAGLVHQGDHIACARRGARLDEVGVHGRYARTADRMPLQPRGLHQAPRALPRRVGEHAAEGAHPLRLRRPPVCAELIQPCADLHRVARGEREPHRGHHLITLHGCAPVSHGQLVAPHPAPPLGVADHRPVEHLREIRRIRARIHGHGAARRSGDTCPELQAGQARRSSPLHGAGQGGAAAAPQGAGAPHRDGGQPTGQADDQPPEPGIVHDEIGPLAHHRHRCVVRARPGERPGDSGKRRARGERIGRPAHLDTGERRQGNVARDALDGVTHRHPRGRRAAAAPAW